MAATKKQQARISQQLKQIRKNLSKLSVDRRPKG